MRRLAPIAVLSLALAASAGAQTPEPKAPTTKASASKTPHPDYTLASADKDLSEIAASVASFETCADAVAWLEKDAADTERRLGPNPAASLTHQAALLAIKRNRLGTQKILCGKLKNDLGTRINVVAAGMNEIWPPTEPGIATRRSGLVALDDKYVAASAKLGPPAQKVNLVSANPADTSGPKLPKTKKAEPAPPKPSSGDMKGFNKF